MCNLRVVSSPCNLVIAATKTLFHGFPFRNTLSLSLSKEMDLINQFLNIVAPPTAITLLLFILPSYWFFKFLASILSYIFSENVAGKVVIIAGASSGIGEHLAYEYARRGACLALAARRKNSLREVGERALLLGSPDVLVVPSDVSKVDDCKRLIHETINHFGRHHLVNDAGVTPLCMFEEPSEITKMAPVMDINFWGYVYTTRFAIPHLRRSKGKIIVIGSSASWLYAPRLSFYAASKAAVISFFETLRVELGSDIEITIVNPGLIESEMTKGKFLNKDGRMVVDQEMRDVELSIVPVERVERGAKAIVDSACRGENYLTEPSWFRTTFIWRVFCPEILDWLNHVFLIPPPGAPPTEALSKKILDLTGLKKYIYPPSLLSPVIKVG
ncbi:11-beta-hydroxysteroid dehydrogenase A-like isoform X2 [Rhododendron vialii]|uniref:11-beta-hydroxysteroid dehydrogenase A-like isoform X2 n=1 Tax=Rhododendron vialii TaxID=182163 RepID=UPI00265DA1B8|nr:11-beta-hydroxysteroid dehydrogenase A-like isoform X2 [Rhododendron vialii]